MRLPHIETKMAAAQNTFTQPFNRLKHIQKISRSCRILGNNGRAVSDAVQALKLNPQNVKAAYRGAKACSSLKHWSRAIDFSTQGLKFDAENADLRDLLHAAKASKDKEDSLMRKALVEKSRLRRALEQRNAAVDALGLVTGSTMPAHAEAISSASVTVDSSGVVSFPLLLLYDEVGQSDFVQYDHAFSSCVVFYA